MSHCIHIVGASGSGTTTLGRALSERLGCPHFDSDDYFWLPTEPPYQVKRTIEERQRLLLADLQHHEDWVLSGSLCGWGDVAIPLFTHVVFLWIPSDLRLKRLRCREQCLFGAEIEPEGTMYETHRRLMEWAAQYDTGDLSMRSRQLHEAWLSSLPCPVVRLEEDFSVPERVERVLRQITRQSR